LGIELRAEVHLPAEDGPQLVTVAEEPKPDAPGTGWLEVSEHVNVARRRIEVITHDRAEHAQPRDAFLATERGEAVRVEPNRQA
jgi:hypothetical protein